MEYLFGALIFGNLLLLLLWLGELDDRQYWQRLYHKTETAWHQWMRLDKGMSWRPSSTSPRIPEQGIRGDDSQGG